VSAPDQPRRDEAAEEEASLRAYERMLERAAAALAERARDADVEPALAPEPCP
jgi:hypothetical protein